MTAAANRQQILTELEAREADWSDPADFTDGLHWPCVFYDLARFADLLAAAVEAITDTSRYLDDGTGFVPYSLLEVGCGIGTKAAYAQRAHGLYVEGIDRIPGYVAAARRLRVNAYMTDAARYSGYGDFGIVFVNHPFRRREDEEPLERKIQAAMMPGSVLISVNSNYFPYNMACPQAVANWEPLTRPDLWPIHGAWRKPPVRSAHE